MRLGSKDSDPEPDSEFDSKMGKNDQAMEGQRKKLSARTIIEPDIIFSTDLAYQ